MTTKMVQDVTLSNGSVVYWSRRFKRGGKSRVPVRCGRCRQERSVYVGNPQNKAFTGFCNRCAPKRQITTDDEPLSTGAVVCWSRRFKRKTRWCVPVRCPGCGQERSIIVRNYFKRGFTGVCSVCTAKRLSKLRKGRSNEDETLPSGSVVYWSRRYKEDGYWRVPVRCGKCGGEHVVLVGNVHKITGLCDQCNRTDRRRYVDTGTETLPNGSIVYWDDEIVRQRTRYVLVRCGGSACGHTARYVSIGALKRGNASGLCSRCAAARGPKSPKWKGRKVNTEGYVLVCVDAGDPLRCMADANGYVLEHRLVMARYLGRPLNHNEIVHHRNMNKQDNRLENLQLMIRAAAHPGYRSAEEEPEEG